MGVEFGSGVESEPPQLQIQAAPCQAQVSCRLGDIAGRPIERGLNELAFDLFDGGGEVCIRSERTRTALRHKPLEQVE